MSKVQTAETYQSKGALVKLVASLEAKLTTRTNDLILSQGRGDSVAMENGKMVTEIFNLKKERTAIRKEARLSLKNRDNSIKQLKSSVADYKKEQERLLLIIQGKDSQIRGLENVMESQVEYINGYKRQLVDARTAKSDFIELPWWNRLLTRAELKDKLHTR